MRKTRSVSIASLQKDFVEKHSAEFTPVQRDKIYGSEHIFPQLKPILEILKNYRAYHRQGLPVDGGAVLCGSPGMGKTMFSRWIATEGGARFVDVRAFPVEVKSGVSLWQPKDVAALFRLSAVWSAKNDRPVVLFVDQADNFFDGVQASVKTQFEIELDGFLGRGAGVFLLLTSQSVPQVVLMFSDDDDDAPIPTFGGALFRRGRVGIHVPFKKPDFGQSAELLKGFLTDHPHEDGIACDDLAHLLSAPSAADIKYAVAEARQFAQRELINADKDTASEILAKAPITEGNLIEVFLSKVLDKASGQVMTDKEKYETAIHELGHYVVARALGIAAHFVSIRIGLQTLGITFSTDDAKTTTHEDVKRNIAFSSGGWEAERLCGIPPNTGKIGDLDMANDAADFLVTVLGDRKKLRRCGKLFADHWFSEGSGILQSQRMLTGLEDDLAAVLIAEERRARKILRFFGKDLLQKIARILAEKSNGVMLRNELDALLQPKLAEFHKKYHITDRIKKNVA
ncbi:MAG: AAA family ATPase [Minisyncoccia bacterium]|jgi:SpoVK/Ycf46/Vps4 family AAA+-type ATPase